VELTKVLEEIENKGEYWRGDSRVWVKNGKIHCEYLPKKDYSLIELLKEKGINRNLKLEFDRLLRIEADYESLKDLVNLVNSIEYPDKHVTKRAGCKVTISNGKVEVGEPRILYCPLAKETYGRKACPECTEVKPFLKMEFENKIVEGMFTEGRKICENKARYTYGASEMLMDALKEKVIDAAIVVCEGVGTIVVENPEIVQGIGEKMTGVFYTSPHKKLIKRLEENSFVVFPETARIDQIKGIDAARRLGYKKIAVTTADKDSNKLKKIKEINAEIIALALCTTGIDEKTVRMIKEYADLVWACGSKHVRELVGPESWVQLGTRLPVFVLTERGFDLAKPRIKKEFGQFYDDLFLNLNKKYHNCKEVNKLPIRSEDEPYPLI